MNHNMHQGKMSYDYNRPDFKFNFNPNNNQHISGLRILKPGGKSHLPSQNGNPYGDNSFADEDINNQDLQEIAHPKNEPLSSLMAKSASNASNLFPKFVHSENDNKSSEIQQAANSYRMKSKSMYGKMNKDLKFNSIISRNSNIPFDIA